MNELRRCDLCDKPFVADVGWKRKCILCWKEENSYPAGKGDAAFGLMRDAYSELDAMSTEALLAAEQKVEESSQWQQRAEAETARVKKKAYRVRQAYKTLRKELSEVRSGKGVTEKVRVVREPALTPARVKALIVLCHPDKHGNNERATVVTKWLLGLREKDKS